MRRHFLLIANPIAGRGESPLVEQVARKLEDAGANVQRVDGNSPAAIIASVRKAAISGEVDAVLAAGGDGTIRVAAKAIVGTAVALGAIPLGTGNVLAHELDLPRTPELLARQFLHNPARPLATATVNDELFLLMVGVGFDGHVISRLDHSIKQRVGKFAYLKPGLTALLQPPAALQITADGREYQAFWAIVTNACRYGGSFQLTGRTSIEADGLVAILFHDRGKLARVRDILRIARGQLDMAASVAGSGSSVVSANQVQIASETAVPVQIDGDPHGTTPILVKSHGPKIHLIMPDKPA